MTEKIFLRKDYKENKFHPLLSEFIEMVSWCAQCWSPNFMGALAYFNKELGGAYGVDYLWLEDKAEKEKNERTRLRNMFHGLLYRDSSTLTEQEKEETRLRNMIQTHLDSIRENVKLIGWLDEGHKVIRGEYENLDKFKKSMVKSWIWSDDNLTRRLADIFLEEKVINGNAIYPENIFYFTSTRSDYMLQQQEKTWLETIEKASKLAKDDSFYIDSKANSTTRFLALEGLKHLRKQELKV